jgi:hypothetical protein
MSYRGNPSKKYLCKDDIGSRLSQTMQIDLSIIVVKHNQAISYI